jgi:hypothetical protein
MIAARLVAIRVWWFHTRIGEGSADVANRILGDFEVLSHQKRTWYRWPSPEAVSRGSSRREQ